MKILIIFLVLVGSTSLARAGDEYWGNIEHGDSSKIGRFEYYEDGTSAARVGRHKFYSDGTSETTVGRHTFRNDGESSTKVGSHTFRSDGNDGVDIGKTHYSNKKSIRKSGRYNWTND